MGRLELNGTIDSFEQLVQVCNRAKNENWDAVFVPPFFVSSAAEILGRTQITIVTTAAHAADHVQTKTNAISIGAQQGANEIVVCIPKANILDERWDVVEKELFQMATVAQAMKVILWVSCGFSYLSCDKQAKICTVLPSGMTGLREPYATPKDVRLARICGVKLFSVNAEHDEDCVELVEAGATQLVLCNKPSQKKTTALCRTEVDL